MANPVLMITGASGQLGSEIKVLSEANPAFSWLFLTEKELLIDDVQAVENAFKNYRPDFCINCAAYTAVDKAETDTETAFRVNATATGILADACKRFETKFIHISTDYVFDGTSPVPYKEDDATQPVNQYGESKLKGEQLCLQNNPEAIIIRTAWLYSAYGHNFVKTMLRLMNGRDEISVVNDQIGAPTYAADLAHCLLHIIHCSLPADHPQVSASNWRPGIYHFSNGGKISWYDFAVAIKELTGSGCTIKPVTSVHYPTPAKRPAFSLLDTGKIQQTYNYTIPAWKDGLERCLQRLSAQVP